MLDIIVVRLRLFVATQKKAIITKGNFGKVLPYANLFGQCLFPLKYLCNRMIFLIDQIEKYQGQQYYLSGVKFPSLPSASFTINHFEK